MDCGANVLKFLLFGFNFLFFLASLALIVISAYFLNSFKDLDGITSEALPDVTIAVLCSGILILFFSFLGCCGAFMESYCMLATYAVFMIILFIFELSAGITAIVLREKLQRYAVKAVTSAIKEYNDAQTEHLAFLEVQQLMKCCGGANYTDWLKSAKFKKEAAKKIKAQNITKPAAVLVPDVCCVSKTTGCGLSYQRLSQIYQDGCNKKIMAYINEYSLMFGGISLGVALIFQVTGTTFAFCLMTAIRKRYETV